MFYHSKKRKMAIISLNNTNPLIFVMHTEEFLWGRNWIFMLFKLILVYEVLSDDFFWFSF
jgi:hypothetical protein